MISARFFIVLYVNREYKMCGRYNYFMIFAVLLFLCYVNFCV